MVCALLAVHFVSLVWPLFRGTYLLQITILPPSTTPHAHHESNSELLYNSRYPTAPRSFKIRPLVQVGTFPMPALIAAGIEWRSAVGVLLRPRAPDQFSACQAAGVAFFALAFRGQ
jgi:hypothetical protein